ncbi:cbb3-type cytochrome c oxidase subunit 3 [Sphingomonas quercus]|uniref:Cbb3-type cytochrome c oxidase subunit 3 n=1 Tax=Sphingomonas quercus TaxID=2842451 RepID=A0ABS6BNI3_9SPHN|nr:cbb3-type cytochrome c oxidase subunit 3 [Sphingomonas quercus]MBU3079361.1 cbb3-type cytochrome c oxidase subunit 3 [Sphingomonas quercus]
MSYDALRHAADSWGLLCLTILFLFAVWRALRPSARADQEAASLIPLDDEGPRA